jgi:UDP-N-acetylglucosamine:LPS N-acetylglucosamine transferase
MTRRVLAISSTGGHWVQLLRLMPAFDGADLALATSEPAARDDALAARAARGQAAPGFFTFTEANRWQKARLLRQVLTVVLILVRTRPHVIVSTGAAVGYFAIRLGRMFGARGVWIDSIANVEELSLAGRKVGPHAHLWLTQWPELASDEGPSFRGSVL